MKPCLDCGEPAQGRALRCPPCRRAHKIAAKRAWNATHTDRVAAWNLASRMAGRDKRPCHICGSPARAGYCAACSVAFAVRLPRLAPCDGCLKTTFTRSRRSQTVVYCRACRAAARRDSANKRYALKVGAQVEDVSAVVVFTRDRWTCGICKLPIDSQLRYPDPGSASVDHVHPLSRGGSHSYDNVQAAHLRCNVSKGARVA